MNAYQGNGNFNIKEVPLMPSNVMSPEEAKQASKPKLTEGIKYDDHKLPVHLLPFDAIMQITEILQEGAKKYEERNWERGMDWHRPYRACLTHLWKWWIKLDEGKGPGMDEETGKSHLLHAGACILFLVAYEHRKIGRDTRP